MPTHRSFVALSLILLFPACRTAPVPSAPSPRLPELAGELVAMAAADQQVRSELVAFIQDHPGEDPSLQLALRMLSLDAENTARIQTIVAEHGWPTSELVGREASRAAWLLVQHADSAPDFQAAVLGELEPLLAEGAIDRRDYALLTDRVLVAREQAQRYGTQYVTRTVEGVPVFAPATPIEDPANLDARRASMGLEPHADYVEELRAVMGIPDDIPVTPTPAGVDRGVD